MKIEGIVDYLKDLTLYWYNPKIRKAVLITGISLAGIIGGKTAHYFAIERPRMNAYYAATNTDSESLESIMLKENVTFDEFKQIPERKYKGREYKTAFDGEKYKPWQEAGFSITTYWTCQDHNEKLEDITLAVKMGFPKEKFVPLLDNGGEVTDAILGLAAGKSVDETLQRYAKQASQE